MGTGRIGGALFPLLFLFFAADALSTLDGLGSRNFRGHAMILISSACNAGLLMTPALLVGRKARALYMLILPLLSLSTMIQWYCRLRFSMNLDGDWIGILVSSSFAEASAFLRSSLTPAFVLGLLSAMGTASLVTILAAKHQYRKSAFLGFAFLGAYLLLNAPSLTSPMEPLWRCPTFNLVLDSIQQGRRFRELNQMRTHPRIPTGLSYHGDTNMVAVCIIGESATRNRWSLNGYPKPTTPKMDSRRQELCVFTNLLSSAANTAEALRFLLTEATKSSPGEMNCTLPQMLASTGVQGVLLSNHGRWGPLDGTETFLFSGCRTLLFLSEENLPKPWYDDALLPFLDRELKLSGHAPIVIFLHLYGSHQPASERYPIWFSPFPPEHIAHSYDLANPLKMSNHYDNSIAFTDVLLDRVIQRLQSLNRPTMMVYLSDHGESVNSSSIRNAADASTWEIPMICWFSAEFRNRHPDTVRMTKEAQHLPWTTDSLLPLLLRLFLVDGYGS